MGDCDRCDGDDDLAYSCQYCNGTFCSDHRLPENHNCLGLTDAVSVGKRFESGFDDSVQSDEPEPQLEHKTGRTVSETGTKDFFCRECGTLLKTNSGVCNNCGSDSLAQEGKQKQELFPSSPDVAPDESIRSPEVGGEDEKQSSSKPQQKEVISGIKTGFLVLVAQLLSIVGSRQARKLFVVGVLVIAGGAQAGYISTPGFPVDTEPLESSADDAVRSLGELGHDSEDLNRSQIETHIHKHINEERTARGLRPLNSDTELRTIARYHSDDMADRQYFAHTSPGGEDVSNRYAKFGYSCRVATGENQYVTGAENIAYTYAFIDIRTDSGETVYHSNESEIARGLVNQWMNSSGHRKNILRPYWQNEGIGIVIVEVEGDVRIYATQNFC